MLEAGCVSHFLLFFVSLEEACAQSLSSALSAGTVVTGTAVNVTFSGAGRLRQTHSLTSRLAGHHRLGHLLAEDMLSSSGDQSVHQQHPQAAHSQEYPKHHKFPQPKRALLVTEMFSTTAKTLHTGMDGLSKKITEPWFLLGCR